MKRLVNYMVSFLSGDSARCPDPALRNLLALTGCDINNLFELAKGTVQAQKTHPDPAHSILHTRLLAGFDQISPDMQLYVVSQCLAACNISSALNALAAISYETLRTPRNRGLYARYTMYVGRIDEALDVLNRNEKTGDVWLSHYIDKANVYKCLWQLDDALTALHRYLDIHEEHPAVLTNKALLLYILGQFDEAIAISVDAIRKYSEHHVALTVANDLIARIHRDCGDFAQALLYHERATECSRSAVGVQEWPNWTWWIFLERARTLRMIGQYEKALDVAEKGIVASDSPGNTCSAFADLVKYQIHSVVPAIDTIHARIDLGRRSVYPNLPHAALVYLWSAAAIKLAGNDQEAKNVVNKLLLNQYALEPNRRNQLVSECQTTPWWSQLNLKKIAAAFYPCDGNHEFERDMILSEINVILKGVS